MGHYFFDTQYADPDPQNMMNANPDLDPGPGRIQVNKITKLRSTHLFKVEKKNYIFNL